MGSVQEQSESLWDGKENNLFLVRNTEKTHGRAGGGKKQQGS